MTDSMPTHPKPPDPPADDASDVDWATYLLRVQAMACRRLGSDLYADLLEASSVDVQRSGPAWRLLEPHVTRDADDALAMRYMAAIHRLVLTREAPELALFFPSVGGTADGERAWPVLAAALEQHRETVSDWVARPCQTNEVGRCAALACGFLTVALESGLGLRLLEIGASGGLNLRWDRYAYTDSASGRTWGDRESPVQMRGAWDVPDALTAAKPVVVERAGCDPAPVDPLTDEGRLALTASIWGDQPVRFERLRGALQIAQQLPVQVDAAGAGEWLPPRLAEPAAGVATVVYHSVVMQYLDPAERDHVVQVIAQAGARASEDAPLYWLRMEPETRLRAMAIRLTRWPGGGERLLATSGAHGDPVRWATPAETGTSWQNGSH